MVSALQLECLLRCAVCLSMYLAIVFALMLEQGRMTLVLMQQI